MQEKLIVRYFYSPICPESFATLERLITTFNNAEYIFFEHFNVAEEKLVSDFPWFAEEERLIETIYRNGTKPLLYAKLFINGEEIGGFPPSRNQLQEKIKFYGLDIDMESYRYDYGTFPPHDRIECDSREFYIVAYNQENQGEACKACTKNHPYLHEKAYDSLKWDRFEKQKCEYIKKKLSAGDMLGLVAFHKDRPAGFIEAFRVNESAKLGFPVSEREENGAMVTCLSICSEFSGYGLAKRLVQEMEYEARSKGYISLEVLTFPDEHNWQPLTLYSKLGFTRLKTYDNGLSLMKKILSV